MAKTLEQNLEELRQIREMISPVCTVTDEERNSNLERLRQIREMISPACTVTDEERQSNLEHISYISNIRKTR